MHRDADRASTTVAPGARFQFTDRSGVIRSYVVDLVHSFATKRFEYVPMGTFTTDLAILHLTASVPVAQAIPADLAQQEPSSGAASTFFGFGCTDRTPASGGGFKQFLQFTFGTATRGLCWGDSGGPDFFGNAGDGGALWAGIVLPEERGPVGVVRERDALGHQGRRDAAIATPPSPRRGTHRTARPPCDGSSHGGSTAGTCPVLGRATHRLESAFRTRSPTTSHEDEASKQL